MSILLLFDCLDPSFLLLALFLLSIVDGLRPVLLSLDAFDPSSLENCSFILRITCDVPSVKFPNISFMLLMLLCEELAMAPNTDPSPDLLVCKDCRLGMLLVQSNASRFPKPQDDQLSCTEPIAGKYRESDAVSTTISMKTYCIFDVEGRSNSQCSLLSFSGPMGAHGCGHKRSELNRS